MCGAWLQGDEVDKVTLGWGHIVREEIDERVEQLRALGVRLIHIWKACDKEKKKKFKINKYIWTTCELICTVVVKKNMKSI